MAENTRRDLLPNVENEDWQLAEKLLQRGLPIYRIREALMERGYSAVFANHLIASVRAQASTEEDSALRIELVLAAIILLVLALALVVSVIVPAISGGA